MSRRGIKHDGKMNRCIFWDVQTLVLAFLWCQHFSGARAFFWCQSLSGISIFLVLDAIHTAWQ
jgi:hypothetical protein